MVSEERSEQHLEAQEVAAYVDGAISSDRYAAIQAHLATCAECRAEVFDVSRIVRSAPSTRTSTRPWARRIWISMAAAAVVVVLAKTWTPPQETAPVHRGDAQTAVAPRALSPTGQVDGVTTFVWSSVPQTESYHIRLFDSQGTVLWETQIADTVAKLPRSVFLRPGSSYFWKVVARTGFDRETASDLTEFLTRGGRQQ
jgi:hypothetical protein